MKTRSINSVGALHPILFFAVMYFVVLFFSIFICSSLFYSCSSTAANADTVQEKSVPAKQETKQVAVSAAVVLR